MLLALFSWIDEHSPQQVPFDSARWQHATVIEHGRTVRSRMINDLLRRHEFRNWNRHQFVNLPGPPVEKLSIFQQYDLVYVLGTERHGSFSIDDETLGFNFNSHSTVIEYGLSVN